MDKLRLDLDFSKDPIAQDMICRIMRDKGFQTPQEAVQYGVNSDTATDIIENRWAQDAYIRWRHADPERELHWIPLAEPKFIVEIDEYQQACLNLAECIHPPVFFVKKDPQITVSRMRTRCPA